jgi:hypothetical protein
MSQVVHETTLQGVRPFFGCNNDIRGEFFTHLNYLGSEFSVAINNGNVPMIVSQPVLQLLLCKNYTNCGAGEELFLHEDMVDLVANAAAFHKIIDSDAKVGAANSSAFVKYLFDAVYKQWNSLSSDVRKFYSTFLHVLIKNSVTGQWDQPTDVAMAANFSASDVRLNLTKVNKADSNSGILFAETLPKLPATAVSGFRFTPDGQAVKSVPCPSGCPVDLLKQIYLSVYIGGTVALNGVNMGAYTYINCDANKRDFKLDAIKFSKNVILAHAQGASAKQTTAAAAAAGKDNFDDIFTSLTTGVTFMRKGEDLVRIDGDKQTVMDQAQLELDLDAKNGCHGTRINGDCDVVFQCLLNGNPKNLSRCLGKLKDQNMFKVAEREVELMNPHVATQLLKTFGFTPRKESPSGLILPPSFDDWRRNILPNSVDSETQEAIVDNAQLMNYLKGLVNLLRSNPAILNVKMGEENLSPYATRAGIHKFVQPKLAGDRSQLTASILEQGILLSRPNVNTMPLGGLFQNIGMNMMNSPFGLQQGGGDKPNCPNANMLKNMFDVTYSEMERNGKVLVDADKKRIDDSVKRVAHLEEQLVRILEDLKLFTKLNTTFGIGRGSVGIDEVALTEVVGASQASSVTGEALGNLKNCASQNITEQSKLTSDLILQIQKSLVGTLMGAERNPLLERVYSGRM